MRKFGLGRDQRAQVIRATGGSSRFDDIEKILRAPEPSVQQPDTEPQCVCCCRHDAGEPHKHDHEPSIETLYEESDWVDVPLIVPLVLNHVKPSSMPLTN
jgi:hypothetical protein